MYETRVDYIVRIGFLDINFENVPKENIYMMASKKVFDLMEAEDWTGVTELLTNTVWTSKDLEEKHGVRNSIELYWRVQMATISISIILLYLKLSVFWGNSFSSLYYVILRIAHVVFMELS